MPKIPMLDNAAVRVRQENLPTYTPQKLESNAEELGAFAKSMEGVAELAHKALGLTAGVVNAVMGASEAAAADEIELNEFKAGAEMEAYAKEHPEDFANFEAKNKEITEKYAARNQELLDGMRWRAKNKATKALDLSRERRSFNTQQCARKGQIEFNFKKTAGTAQEFVEMGQYQKAREIYRSAGIGGENGEPALMSQEQVRIGIESINSQEQFDQFSGWINGDGTCEVMEWGK